jgi:hypothetical protein
MDSSKSDGRWDARRPDTKSNAAQLFTNNTHIH